MQTFKDIKFNEGEFLIQKEIESDPNFSILAAIEPQLFRGINDVFTNKNDKEFYEGCHLEIREQAIKNEKTNMVE